METKAVSWGRWMGEQTKDWIQRRSIQGTVLRYENKNKQFPDIPNETRSLARPPLRPSVYSHL